MMLRKFMILFRLSVASAIITGIALMSVPIIGLFDSVANTVFTYAIGIAIWIGLICFICFSIKTNNKRKKIEAKLKKNNSIPLKKKRIGCFSFFKNKEAIISDIIFIISAIIAVLLMFLNRKSEIYTFLIFSVMFLSFCLHCYLNGTNYVYFKLIKKYFKSKE